MATRWFNWLKRDADGNVVRGFMARLREDRRGNALAILAGALIPMAGMVGGGIDLSRMYIVKTRLQHACDSGALAGRKAMGSGTWSQSNYKPRDRADEFFKANFQNDAYGIQPSTTTHAFTESAGTVNGTASAVVPMTLMRVLGKTTETIAVTCEAEMRLPNTDVMFVLDTTGSMADVPSGDSDSKIKSLKIAVKCFYEIVARLDTDVTCTTGTPSGGVGNQVQVRFGFMPYSTNVNVGKLLPTSYFADTWNYQSRVANWNPPGTSVNGPYWQEYGSVISQSDCLKYMKNESFSGFTPTAVNAGGPPPTPTVVRTFPHDGAATEGGNNGEWGWTGADDTTGNNRSCRRKRTDTTTTYQTFKDWTYKQVPVDISGLKSGTNWNSSIVKQVGASGTDRTITWGGCIEERPTTRTTDYDPIPNNAYDLNIDLVPSSGNANSLWGPALQQLIYARAVTTNWNQLDRAESTTTADYTQSVGYYCPTEAKKLQIWNDANAFDTYVDSLTPSGNTYHDIGLLWGARFASSTGIFASENALTPLGGEIDRHIIFMTDGDACTGTTDYNAYGVPWLDRRQTPANTAPTDGCTSTGTLTQQVNLRTEALCTAIRNKNITLWVIAFGNLATSTETRLQNCASEGRYFKATNAATLQQTFKSIAEQISALRLTK